MTREERKLGFLRWCNLSHEHQKQLSLAHVAEHGNKSHYDFIVLFFGQMTKLEFDQYKIKSVS
jgi:hypothetical protein